MDVKQFYELYKTCNKVTIDSRKIEKGDIFFAFSGVNFDAAVLAEHAVAHGAIAVIVENAQFANPAKNIFYRPSTLVFLQELASYHRQNLRVPIIGLTGSNGKTTTKELIAAVLAKKFNVQFTQGNLNNHIGVPLSLLSVKPEHGMAVIEMGANHQREIAALCAIARPDIGYITNFGKAHLEGFGGIEGVIKGKSELYDFIKAENKTVLVNQCDALQAEKTASIADKITFGTPASDYCFEKLYHERFVGLSYGAFECYSQLTGEYNFANLSAAAALGLHFGIDFNQIKAAIESYVPTNMRSQVMERNGRTLVLDTYNANPSSMAASLQNFSKFPGTKTVILGDMLELGSESEAEHRLIYQLAEESGFEEIFTVGPEFMAVSESTGRNFTTTAELALYLSSHNITTDNVLLKGSRGIALEKVLDVL